MDVCVSLNVMGEREREAEVGLEEGGGGEKLYHTKKQQNAFKMP